MMPIAIGNSLAKAEPDPSPDNALARSCQRKKRARLYACEWSGQPGPIAGYAGGSAGDAASSPEPRDTMQPTRVRRPPHLLLKQAARQFGGSLRPLFWTIDERGIPLRHGERAAGLEPPPLSALWGRT